MADPADQRLRAVPLFADLTDAQFARVSAAGRELSLEPRQVVVREADHGDELFVVLGGRLKVTVSDAEGRETVFNLLGPGEVFGEIALLDGGVRSATVAALEPTAVMSFGRDAFYAMLETCPSVARTLLEILAARLRRLSERAENIDFLPIPARLALLLDRMAERWGKPTDDGTLIDLPLSQEELGQCIGATRESVNKCINMWSRSGVVRQSSGKILVLDPAALAALAGR